MVKIVNLCGDSGCCPVVEVLDNEVKIGEAGNLCTLKKEEFETLKTKIKTGEL